MKKLVLLAVILIASNLVQAQTFYERVNNKFISNKISVLNISPEKISIKVYYNSSSRCACEENETIEINKNEKGEFVYSIEENSSTTLKINFKANKISFIKVDNTEDDNCCSIMSGDYYLYDIDFADPKSVVNAIFYAAQTNDFGILQCLCDPYGQGDGDTKALCSISQIAKQIEDYGGSANSKKALDDFVKMFESGRISGQVTYESYEGTQYAKVPFLFNHPGGASRSEDTMKLVKRHGNWYLSSF